MLSPDRGGLRVGAEEQDEYERLVAELRAHASSGYMYATPDCPEVYFLSGLRNPTRTFFDFFDEPWAGPLASSMPSRKIRYR